jgi:hypothetical protein
MPKHPHVDQLLLLLLPAILQARQAALSQLLDERGILFVGGGKKMLGAITATLWVSAALLQHCCAVAVTATIL